MRRTWDDLTFIFKPMPLLSTVFQGIKGVVVLRGKRKTQLVFYRNREEG